MNSTNSNGWPCLVNAQLVAFFHNFNPDQQFDQQVLIKFAHSAGVEVDRQRFDRRASPEDPIPNGRFVYEPSAISLSIFKRRHLTYADMASCVQCIIRYAKGHAVQGKVSAATIELNEGGSPVRDSYARGLLRFPGGITEFQ